MSLERAPWAKQRGTGRVARGQLGFDGGKAAISEAVTAGLSTTPRLVKTHALPEAKANAKGDQGCPHLVHSSVRVTRLSRHRAQVEGVNPHYEPRITVAFRPQIVAPTRQGYSRSPCKPALWMQHVQQTALGEHIDTFARFDAATPAQLASAHTPDYLSAFLTGEPRALAESSGNGWSPGYRDSVLAKVGALIAAGRHAVGNPSRIVVCPTSGDHHAQPERGVGFCPIAGQVIAGLDLFRSTGIATAWIDTDEHDGNAIPDAAATCPDVRRAIPFNINPTGSGAAYLASLDEGLARIEHALVAGTVGLVCVGHGADSHEWDDLGGSVTTAQWLETARRTYAMVRRASDRLRRAIPVVISFFGGYRDDDYASVLELHVADVAMARDSLAQTQTPFVPRVSPPRTGARAHAVADTVD